MDILYFGIEGLHAMLMPRLDELVLVLIYMLSMFVLKRE